MNSMKSRFKKSEKIVSRKVADEFILVPICRSTKEVESIYTLNEVAARVWELIDGKETMESISDRIREEFEVSKEEAQYDIKELFDHFMEINVIKKVD